MVESVEVDDRQRSAADAIQTTETLEELELERQEDFTETVPDLEMDTKEDVRSDAADNDAEEEEDVQKVPDENLEEAMEGRLSADTSEQIFISQQIEEARNSAPSDERPPSSGETRLIHHNYSNYCKFVVNVYAF